MTNDDSFSVVPISPDHDLTTFDCGQNDLNAWLRIRAAANEANNASRTYLAVTSAYEVIGYSSLSTGAVGRSDVQGFLRRNMPEPAPVLVLGRLAVDLRFQSQEIGRLLAGDALYRALRISRDTGVRGLIVHALTDDVIDFYKRLGFQSYRSDPRDLVMLVSELERTLTGRS